MRVWLSHLTYANVTATLALVVALSGTAYAATTIGTDQIRNGAVTTPKIRNSAVTAAKLANGAATGKSIRDRSITATKLAKGAVTNEKIKDGSIGSQELSNGAVTYAKLAPGSLRADLFAAGQAPGVDPAKIRLQVRTLTLLPSQSGSVVIDCPEGSNVVSGGYFGPGPVVEGDLASVPAVTASYPAPPTSSRGYTSWAFRASTSSATGAGIQFFAVCVAS